ncbi:hypothetical protein K9L97_05705 [Candidatus Woesearchaeota archaeon]|nr:hypothetical protein [Candidatus Woesearchaeota archaeon]
MKNLKFYDITKEDYETIVKNIILLTGKKDEIRKSYDLFTEILEQIEGNHIYDADTGRYNQYMDELEKLSEMKKEFVKAMFNPEYVANATKKIQLKSQELSDKLYSQDNTKPENKDSNINMAYKQKFFSNLNFCKKFG